MPVGELQGGPEPLVTAAGAPTSTSPRPAPRRGLGKSGATAGKSGATASSFGAHRTGGEEKKPEKSGGAARDEKRAAKKRSFHAEMQNMELSIPQELARARASRL